MTVICKNMPTKKALREAPQSAIFVDPADINPIWDGISFQLKHLKKPTEFTCTNHPKRSWFAIVRVDADGNVEVK